DRRDYVAIGAGAVRGEHAQIDQIHVGSDAAIPPSGVCAVGADDARDVGAVAILIPASHSHEVFAVNHAAGVRTYPVQIGVGGVDTAIDHGHADARSGPSRIPGDVGADRGSREIQVTAHGAVGRDILHTRDTG